MDYLAATPYLFRILLSLLAILVFQKLTKRLDAAMLLGIGILAVWTGHSPESFLGVVSGRVLSVDTLFLVIVIASVIWLSTLMSHTGIMKDLVGSLRSKLPARALFVALPAIVGLLPMPAGALFSCPLIDDADGGGALPPPLKAKINYWFRHIWEFCWPLYPGVLLAVDISGLPVWKMLLILSPLVLGVSGAGGLFLLRQVPAGPPREKREGTTSIFLLILPTLTVIAVYALVMILFPAVGRVNRYLPMAIGTTCALAVMQLQRPSPAEEWRKAVFSTRWMALVAIIILARVYGAFIEARLADGTPLMDAVRHEMNAFGIPPILLVVLIPFISGLTTGITIGYIGASLPVVLSLASGFTTGGYYAYLIMGYACGYIGMMLSPIHACLLVTNEYFKTGLFEHLSGLMKPALAFFLYTSAYALLWWHMA